MLPRSRLDYHYVSSWILAHALILHFCYPQGCGAADKNVSPGGLGIVTLIALAFVT